MKNILLFAAFAMSLSDPVFAQSDTAQTDTVPLGGFCIVNASEESHLFATETREGVRQLQELAPGAKLCATQTGAADGVVSVFENAEGFEGCSRVIAVGTLEEMTKYAEFDRCGWSSHNS